MPFRQKVFAIAISIAILVAIVELVRRRKLREEYSFLWLAIGALTLVLATWYGLLKAVTKFIGAGFTTSTLFFFAIVFLMLMNLHFSIKISELTEKVKNIAQEIALMRAKEEGKPETESSKSEEKAIS